MKGSFMSGMQGLAGALVFAEPIGIRWGCGAVLILLGVALCTAGRRPQPAPDGSGRPHAD